METTKRVYEFIYRYAMAHGGNTPTYAEVSAGVGISKTVVWHHVHKLIRMGKLDQKDKKLVVRVLVDMLAIIGEDDEPDWNSEETARDQTG